MTEGNSVDRHSRQASRVGNSVRERITSRGNSDAMAALSSSAGSSESEAGRKASGSQPKKSATLSLSSITGLTDNRLSVIVTPQKTTGYDLPVRISESSTGYRSNATPRTQINVSMLREIKRFGRSTSGLAVSLTDKNEVRV